MKKTIPILALTLVCALVFFHWYSTKKQSSQKGSTSMTAEKMPSTIQRQNPLQMENSAELYLAGGCFWGTQAYLSELDGVLETDVGYANGITEYPTYEDVCTGTTNHAETVHVVYDPQKISLSFLLEMYAKTINPISVNRQGNDSGTQYRTGVYYTDSNDLPTITSFIEKLAADYDTPITIEVLPLQNYALAEDNHQDYLRKNPNGYCHISHALLEQAKTAKE